MSITRRAALAALAVPVLPSPGWAQGRQAPSRPLRFGILGDLSGPDAGACSAALHGLKAAAAMGGAEKAVASGRTLVRI